MGKVTEELVKLITKQVDERGIVVWYDPERAYGEVAASLTPPDTTVLQYSTGCLSFGTGSTCFWSSSKRMEACVTGPICRHDWSFTYRETVARPSTP